MKTKLLMKTIVILLTMFFTVACNYSNDDNQTVIPDIEDPEPDPLPEPLPAEYLAALNLPNSFIVKPGESITIPVIKAFAVWKQYKDILKEELARESNLSVVLVWQDQMDLIESIKLDSNKKEYSTLTVKSSSKTGNAVVALKADDRICWSWHIWVTKYEPNNEINGKVYSWDNNGDGIADYIWMDRNLGAETNGSQLTKTDSLAAAGLFYQWGRKDPLPGDKSFRYTTDNDPPNFDSRPIYNHEGKLLKETGLIPGDGVYTEETNKDTKTPNLLKAIENPLVYLRGMDGAYSDWFGSKVVELDDTLWDREGELKGIFDPCPEGWRVPAYKNDKDPWYGFSEAASPYSRLGVFPYAGFRYVYNNGAIKNSGFQAYIYCATPNKQGNARCLSIYTDYLGNTTPKIDVTSRSTAVSVRCTKDYN